MEIVMERVILNVTESPDRWVAGYAAIIATPEETYALQVKRATGTKFIMCALWAHTHVGMESVASWWCEVEDFTKHVGDLLQQGVTVTWQQ